MKTDTRTFRRLALSLPGAALAAAWSLPVGASGHGPVFALATPTLARGAWSSDTAAMGLQTSAGAPVMFRQMIGYGLTPDLQLNVSVPLAPTLDRIAAPPRSRLAAMMGAWGEAEASVMWRFHSRAPRIGVRRESTLLLGFATPMDARRNGVRVGPSVHLAAVTGYASRSWYWWGGAGYEYYLPRSADRLGALPYLTAALGYRPAHFRNAGRPDWRGFLEAVAEFPGRNRIAGRTDPNSGGSRLLIGPSVLGLFGAWGIGAGMLWPVTQHLNGNQPGERYRWAVNVSYWF